MSKPFNLKRILIVSFIVLLAALFALEFGPGSRRGAAQESAPDVVAHVGNKKITLYELSNFIDPSLEPLLRNPELAEFVRGYYLNLLEGLVDNALLEQLAPREGIAISNAQLRAYLQKNPTFHNKEGQFDVEVYQRAVSSWNLTTVAYEKKRRAEIASNKLQRFLDQLSYVSEEELHAEYALSADKADVRFVRFSPLQLAAQVGTPSQAELSPFMEANKKTIEETYQQNIGDYMEPARRRLRHIFVERPVQSPEADSNETGNIAQKETQARAKAETLLASLQQGADFASLARESSDDLETRAKGGELGWVELFQLPPTLAHTVFGMKAGETSQLLETPRGYFIYQTEELSEAHPKPLQEVQQKIALTLWTQQKSKQQARAQAQQALDNLLKGKPLDSLFPPALAELGDFSSSFAQKPAVDKPEAVTTGLFAANHTSIPKLGDDSALKTLIFGMSSPGPIREIQTLGQDFLVMEVIERQSPTEAGFEEAKDGLRESLQKRRAQQTYAELIRQMKTTEQPQLFPERLQKLPGL